MGLTAACVLAVSKRRAWLADAVSWLLWLGTASAWVAGGLGLLAEKTAPHVAPAEVAMLVRPRRGGYVIEAFLPTAALNGYDPEQHSRLGFFYSVRELPRSELARHTQIDYDREMVFVATAARDGGGDEMCGVRLV